MSQQPDNRIPTPVAHQINNMRIAQSEKAPGSLGYEVMGLCISNFEMILEDERQALILTHATARGMPDIDPIAILWFTKIFLPYVTETTNG